MASARPTLSGWGIYRFSCDVKVHRFGLPMTVRETGAGGPVPGPSTPTGRRSAVGLDLSWRARTDPVTDGLSDRQLGPLLAAGWSLPTAFSLLAWFVFSPQCLATLAAVRRETNSWRFPLLMAGYLFTLAYVASFITYRVALLLTGGGHV